jgi:hypothetical protein
MEEAQAGGLDDDMGLVCYGVFSMHSKEHS